MKLLMLFFALSASTLVAAVNGVDFDAKGDGVTDDAAASHAAIDAVAANGPGKIIGPHSPKGYRIAGPGRESCPAPCMTGVGTVKDRVVVVPAHPDDLIPCFGTCLLSNDIFEWHVIEFTHGERGLGEPGYLDGSAKKIRMEEEGAVCKALGAQLHWLDEIDGEAYACRETCERLAALLRELKPRAVFAHWPVDIHGDHAMAGVAVQKALFLAGLSPELYFIEQEYQAKRFVPDQFVDISDVMERKRELIRMYKCQYRDGGIERRKCAIASVNGMHSMLLAGGYAEGFMSFAQPLQGQRKTIFQELPPPKSRGALRFQGARPQNISARDSQ